MQGLTLAVSILAILVVFMVKPSRAVLVYLAVLVWYPVNLTIKIGTVDLTASRLVIFAVFICLFLKGPGFSKFKLSLIDKTLLIYFILQFIAGLVNIPMAIFIENRAGAAFDYLLPYFAIRMTLIDRATYLSFLKGVLIIAAPLACMGFYQSVTGHNLVGALKTHGSWGGSMQSGDMRMGFYRADVTFTQPIMFGLFFAMMGPVCAGLVKTLQRRRRFLAYAGLFLMGVGAFFSMSSGPILSGGLSIVFISFFRWRKHWKVIVYTIITLCLVVEVLSNRHFYEVIDRFTYSGNTAWYRSKLIEVALFEGGMSGHWFTGYGFSPLGWGPKIDGRGLTDVVNHYIFILARYGLLGLLPLMAVLFLVLKNLRKAYSCCVSYADKWMLWCLAGAMFGFLIGLNSVCLFGQTRTVFYVLLALCANSMFFIESSQPIVVLQSPR